MFLGISLLKITMCPFRIFLFFIILFVLFFNITSSDFFMTNVYINAFSKTLFWRQHKKKNIHNLFFRMSPVWYIPSISFHTHTQLWIGVSNVCLFAQKRVLVYLLFLYCHFSIHSILYNIFISFAQERNERMWKTNIDTNETGSIIELKKKLKVNTKFIKTKWKIKRKNQTKTHCHPFYYLTLKCKYKRKKNPYTLSLHIKFIIHATNRPNVSI